MYWITINRRVGAQTRGNLMIGVMRLFALWVCWGVSSVICLGSALGADGYQRVEGPCAFSFPEDHGAHEGFRTEWWYYTGNLADANGRRFGFQLTFFRTRLTPPGASTDGEAAVSAWRTPHIYLAHMAVTDIDGNIHRFAEDTARGALGLAGVKTEGDTVTVRVKNWTVRLAPDRHELRATAEAMTLALTLMPEKPPVAHGIDGYSRKGDRPNQASCYYSFTRLAASGTLSIDGRPVTVTGLAWMDHEYSTAPLDETLVGWDWFSLQLDDGTDLMLYQLRDRQGGAHAASSGTMVDPLGKAVSLNGEDFSLLPLDFWKSPDTGARYPVRWRLDIPSLGMAMEVSAPVAAQEMRTGRSTGVVYWEGSVTATGTAGEKPVQGRGYLEMTGYAGAFDAPL